MTRLCSDATDLEGTQNDSRVAILSYHSIGRLWSIPARTVLFIVGCIGGVRAMRCMACGCEMTLVSVVNEDTMPVPGFEQHTFTCSECHDTERRLVFAKRGDNGNTEPAVVEAAPSIA